MGDESLRILIYSSLGKLTIIFRENRDRSLIVLQSIHIKIKTDGNLVGTDVASAAQRQAFYYKY